uniref:Uncharacterized protein n=1 Tax=Oryza brachyantha TaxID=4533 RepID=J3KW13_ORYBR
LIHLARVTLGPREAVVAVEAAVARGARLHPLAHAALAGARTPPPCPGSCTSAATTSCTAPRRSSSTASTSSSRSRRRRCTSARGWRTSPGRRTRRRRPAVLAGGGAAVDLVQAPVLGRPDPERRLLEVVAALPRWSRPFAAVAGEANVGGGGGGG